jgi:hypothetical protein
MGVFNKEGKQFAPAHGTIIALAILFFLLSVPAFGAYSPKAIPLSSPFYDQVDALYRLEGVARPSDARPWSNEEAYQILKALPANPKTYRFREQTFALLQKTLRSRGAEDFSYRISLLASLEAYTHTNDEQFVIEEDWIYGGDERKSLLDLRLEAQIGTIFYFGTNIEAGIGIATDKDIEEQKYDVDLGVILPSSDPSVSHVSYSELYHRLFSTNMITKETQFLASWPRISQITLGDEWWNVSMARGAIRWGNGKSGDLVIGSHIVSQNTLRLDVFIRKFKMEFLYLFLGDPEDTINQRIFMGHRFEFHPYNWMRMTLSENVMFRGVSLDWKYLDPTYIYHNFFNSGEFNSLASLEVNLAPCKGLSFYGQFVLDQYQLPNETITIPNATGKLIGLEYSWLEKEGIFSTSLEYAVTDPTLYRRNKVNFLIYRGVQNNRSPYLFDYLGYQYGSDSQVLRFDLSYLSAGSYRIGFNITLLQQGEMTMYHSPGDTETSYPKILESTPSGDLLSQNLILGLKGIWWPTFGSVTLYSQVNWIARRTYTRSTGVIEDRQRDLQLVFGISYCF